MGRNGFQCVVVGRSLHRLYSLRKTGCKTMSTDIPPLKYGSAHEAPATSKSLFGDASKVYELRQYSCSPGDAPEYLKLSRDFLHLRIKHSKLFGFWTSELGGLNQTIHLWEYDDLDHRANVRKNLASDKDWQEKYISKAMPRVSSQTNSVIIPFSWSPLVQPTKDGVYELQIYNMNDNIEVWHDRLKKAMTIRSTALQPLNTKLLGVFYTLFGKQNSVIALWQHETMNKATEGKLKLLTDAKDATITAFYHEVATSYSKAMIPFSFNQR